jgi:hypothetical protein
VCRLTGKRFLASSEVELAQTTLHFFHYHCAAFYSQLRSKVDNILDKATAS